MSKREYKHYIPDLNLEPFDSDNDGITAPILIGDALIGNSSMSILKSIPLLPLDSSNVKYGIVGGMSVGKSRPSNPYFTLQDFHAGSMLDAINTDGVMIRDMMMDCFKNMHQQLRKEKSRFSFGVEGFPIGMNLSRAYEVIASRTKLPKY